MGSPHDRLEKPLRPGGVGRCGRRTLYVPIINPLALTVYAGLFAFHGLRLAAWGRGGTVTAERLCPLCGLILGSEHVPRTKHLDGIPKMGTTERWRNALLSLLTKLPQRSRRVHPFQNRKGGPL